MASTSPGNRPKLTDRASILDQALADQGGLWAVVDSIRSSCPAWGWDRVAAELYRQSGHSVTGVSLRSWNDRRQTAA